MTTVKELKAWLDQLPPRFDDHSIAVDNGGLTLVVYPHDAGLDERINADDDATTGAAYFALGGVALDELE